MDLFHKPVHKADELKEYKEHQRRCNLSLSIYSLSLFLSFSLFYFLIAILYLMDVSWLVD